jgi:phenylalanine-4-hydroxylase
VELLEDKDLIVLSAKQSGGYDDGQFNETCYFYQIQRPKNISFHVDNVLKNDFVVDNVDYLLYAIVNHSLDMTFESLVKDRVQDESSH